MDETTWIFIGISAFIVIMFGLVVVGISSFVEERTAKQRADAFVQDFTAAIVHSQPSWSEVKVMAQVGDVPLPTIFRICGRLLKDILVGKAPDLEPHKALIEGYRRSHQEAEPFEGLPSEVRLQMERVRETLGQNANILEPVTNQMRELFAMYSKETRCRSDTPRGDFFLPSSASCLPHTRM